MKSNILPRQIFLIMINILAEDEEKETNRDIAIRHKACPISVYKTTGIVYNRERWWWWLSSLSRRLAKKRTNDIESIVFRH